MSGRCDFKLANVVLEAADFLEDDTRLLYRCEGPGSTCAFDAERGGLVLAGLVDFTTFLNGVSVEKWTRYAAIDNVRLSVSLSGAKCTLAALAQRLGADGAMESEVVGVQEVSASHEPRAIEMDMPLDCSVAGFAILTEGPVCVSEAHYFTNVDALRPRPVKLALCTTTFRKEEYILANIGRIERDIVRSGEGIADGFHMFVVDNGRTLDAEGLASDWLSVIPNDNVGGSGGFARGMMAAQGHAGDFTHIVLMDDDVRMLPESFKRLHALLSLACDRYSDAFVSGAMMEMERPSLLFEDVSQMMPSGAWQKVKPDLRVDELQGAVTSESINVEVEYAYAGWWFNCMPVSALDEHGLPLPFFVRFDDVEYGLRCKPTYMTMNGICVWHSGFAARFNAAVACFQYVRNIFVLEALYDWMSEPALLFRYWRAFQIWLRCLDYGAAELWLDGLEAYLEGPEALMAADGAKLMADNAAKCEKLVDVSELDADIMEALGNVDPEWLSGDYVRPPWRKIAASIPHDRHWLPDALLSDAPGAVVPGLGESGAPWTKTALRTRLVALLPDGSKGVVRELDRQRYRELRKRFRALMSRYLAEREQVASSYRAKRGEMVSHEYWNGKFGL